MAIESLDIGSKMCGRILRLIEANKSVEEIQEYCETHKALYDSMLREGVGRSGSDWTMEDKQFAQMLDEPADEPNIVTMVKDKVMDFFGDAIDEPQKQASPGVTRGMVSSKDIRG